MIHVVFTKSIFVFRQLRFQWNAGV